MTRINLIHPKFLTDQHLIAEKKEINQLAGQLQKSINSINFNFDSLPNEFVLGTGHVRFFYKNGKFIEDRYKSVTDECIFRGFDAKYNFNDVWSRLGSQFRHDFVPEAKHIAISKQRILDRINSKPNYYRYYGEKIDEKIYSDLLIKNRTYKKGKH